MPMHSLLIALVRLIPASIAAIKRNHDGRKRVLYWKYWKGPIPSSSLSLVLFWVVLIDIFKFQIRQHRFVASAVYHELTHLVKDDRDLMISPNLSPKNSHREITDF